MNKTQKVKIKIYLFSKDLSEEEKNELEKQKSSLLS